MATNPTVSMTQIAEASGFSRSAVSMALRDHPALPAATRKHIQETAERLGYRPNPMVSALMAHRRASNPAPSNITLAFLTNFEQREPWKTGRILPELYEGLVRRAEERGYALEEFWLRERGMSGRRLSQILEHRAIPGVIVCSLPTSHGHLRLDWPKFSAVAIGYSLARPVLHRVISHHLHGIQLAMRKLRHAGYRRMGLIMHRRENARVDGHWLAGFLLEQQALEPAARLQPFLPDDAEWNGTAFREWFERERPDVLLCVHPREIVPWLHGMKLSVPEVGLVNLYAGSAEMASAGVTQNPRGVGANAVDLLIELLNKNERGIPTLPKTVLVEPSWCDGPTLVLPAPREGAPESGVEGKKKLGAIRASRA